MASRGDGETWEPWALECLAHVRRLIETPGSYSASLKELGRTVQDLRLERGPYGPEIHIRYLDAKDGQVYDWDMAIGSPEYETPDMLASTIVINFTEPSIR